MGRQELDVVVVGNVGIDTNVYLYGHDVDWSVEANFSQNLDYVGQAGGYTSRGYARLGKRTAFLGHVGDDPLGRWIRHELSADGIDTAGLFVDPAGTARSVNLMYRDGRRKNFYDGRGHMQLRPDLELCRSVLGRARLAHFHLPNWARLLLPIARELGLVVACDLQDLVSADEPYRQDFVQAADILFFSAVKVGDVGALMERLLACRPERVVVAGMGARGCALGTRLGVTFYPPVQMSEPVVDSNGAGDMLAVGFLASYVLDGYSLEDSIRRGQIAARHACTIRASTAELITAAELEARFRSLQA